MASDRGLWGTVRRLWVGDGGAAPTDRRWQPRSERGSRVPIDFGPPLEANEPPIKPVRLAGCETWAYKLQDNSVDLVAGCTADVFVMDPHSDGMRILFRPDEVAAMRRRPGGATKTVLAYMSIGEAEENRFYWKPHWIVKSGDRVRIAPGAPKWLAAQNNEGWLDNFKVRYWHPAWQDLIVGEGQFLDRIIAAGFDGVYLDIIDGFEFFQRTENRKTAAAEMIAFVRRISRTARAKKPGFLIVPQNGEELMAVAGYRDAVSAIGKEDVFYDQVKGVSINTRPSVKRQKPDAISATVADLRVALDAGIPVMSVEYLQDDPANRLHIPIASVEIRSHGFIPYFGDRKLKQLHPVVPRAASV